MSESDGAAPKGPGPQVLVRGGTTSSRHDRQQHESRAAALQGRMHMDRQNAAVRQGPVMNEQGFSMARMHSLRMMDHGHPQLVLYYMGRDKTVRQECVSEVFMTGDDSGFTMVCPRCLERGVAHGLAQMRIMNSHRKFTIDPRHAGTSVQLRDPDGNSFWVRICGTVTVDEQIRCDSCGIFKVTIENSRVWEA